MADSDPFLEGKTTVRGELMDSGESRSQWREREREEGLSRSNRPDPKAFLASLPPGIPVAPGTACDVITERLGTMDWKQQMEVLAQMKVSLTIGVFLRALLTRRSVCKAFMITHPEQARTLLIAHPQLGYALFQALLINKIVDQSILSVSTVMHISPYLPRHLHLVTSV